MYEEVLEEGRGPRVPRSRGPKVPGSQGPRYLKVTFKYELDSKEGPSCFRLKRSLQIKKDERESFIFDTCADNS